MVIMRSSQGAPQFVQTVRCAMNPLRPQDKRDGLGNITGEFLTWLELLTRLGARFY